MGEYSISLLHPFVLKVYLILVLVALLQVCIQLLHAGQVSLPNLVIQTYLNNFILNISLSNLSLTSFFQIKPLVQPTKDIMNIRNIKYQWHEFFPNGNLLLYDLFYNDYYAYIP